MKKRSAKYVGVSDCVGSVAHAIGLIYLALEWNNSICGPRLDARTK